MDKPTPATPTTESASTATDLHTLPPFEATTAALESALDTISAAVTEQRPDISWVDANNEDTGSCPAPFDATDGLSSYLPNRYAQNVTLTEAQWHDFLAIAQRAANDLGATDVQTMKDEPGDHDVWFTGPAGLFLKFSYSGNLVIATYTGCRLPERKGSAQ